MAAELSVCRSCGGDVDSEGDWRGECAAGGMPNQCEDCGGCICDGSC